MVRSRHRPPHSISKVTMRMPTLLPFGEGRVSGEAIDMSTRSIRRVVGTARRKDDASNRGRPVVSEGSGLNVAERRRLWRESDRVIRPLKPGNAGGGKDPDFWCAFEEEAMRESRFDFAGRKTTIRVWWGWGPPRRKLGPGGCENPASILSGEKGKSEFERR